jgi:cation:H+ antiporter
VDVEAHRLALGHQMALTLFLFVGSAVLIYQSCEFFVNGVEWVGYRLKLAETATGTILAAFGTGLPETVVTFVAVAFGATAAERDIGVGAALGGPLALSTLAYGVVGVTLLGSRHLRVRRKEALEVDCRRLSRDQAWFLSIFLCKLALGLVAFSGKRWFGFLFLAAYGLYVWKELRHDGAKPESDLLLPLRVRPRDPAPSLFWAAFQTLAALVVIFVASRVFVAQLDAIGPWLGMSPQLVALLFSPIATEMPETMNAVIWVRQGKERMALANISGAMMIQATIPTACGLFGTPWLFSPPVVLAAGITAIAVTALYLMFRGGRVSGRQLTLSSLLYLIFAGLLLLR